MRFAQDNLIPSRPRIDSLGQVIQSRSRLRAARVPQFLRRFGLRRCCVNALCAQIELRRERFDLAVNTGTFPERLLFLRGRLGNIKTHRDAMPQPKAFARCNEQDTAGTLNEGCPVRFVTWVL